MFNQPKNTPKSWLAFELNILRRLRFNKVALPFTSNANLGAYLKRWGVKVITNDLLQSSWTKAVAVIQNNAEKLSVDEINLVLEEAYVPRYRLQNPALKNWFSDTDTWWFDNVRQNIERIPSPIKRAIALHIGMSVGDYAKSFDEETLELRQPLSTVFKRIWSVLPEPVNNGQNNICHNKPAHDFIAENHADLMFLRIPHAHNQSLKTHLGWAAWRDEWLRYGDGFWSNLETEQADKLGTMVETKFQYLQLLKETLWTAKNIPLWAVAHVEDGFITTHDIVETVGSVRRVDTIFTKDFSELTGTKAVIITA